MCLNKSIPYPEFALKGNKVEEEVRHLSYGELMRAAIVRAILMKAEFLFLDEPTNHLDIESLEILDELLKQFPGGTLFISHDRHFIARHTKEVLCLEKKRLARIVL